MLRLIHNQTISGSILVNDIDDGLPNKSARRGVAREKVSGSPVLVAGGILAPASYQRDGSSLGGRDKSTLPGVNYPKQKCYIPKYKLLSNGTHDTTIAGYIDVTESDRVLLSQDHGVISALAKVLASNPTYPLITVTSFTAADVAPPTVTTAVLRRGTGAGIAFLTPTVTLTDSGATFVVGDVGKHIKISGAANAGNNGTFVIASRIDAHTITYTNAAGVDADTGNYVIELVVTGTNLTSLSPDITSLIILGTGAETLKQSQFYSLSATTLIVSVTLLASVAPTTSSVKVTADNQTIATAVVVT